MKATLVRLSSVAAATGLLWWMFCGPVATAPGVGPGSPSDVVSFWYGASVLVGWIALVPLAVFAFTDGIGD